MNQNRATRRAAARQAAKPPTADLPFPGPECFASRPGEVVELAAGVTRQRATLSLLGMRAFQEVVQEAAATYLLALDGEMTLGRRVIAGAALSRDLGPLRLITAYLFREPLSEAELLASDGGLLMEELDRSLARNGSEFLNRAVAASATALNRVVDQTIAQAMPAFEAEIAAILKAALDEQPQAAEEAS